MFSSLAGLFTIHSFRDTTVEGAVDMLDPARFAFRPLTPELSMTSVLAWKKLSPYSGAAGKFLEYIKSIHSEHTKV